MKAGALIVQHRVIGARHAHHEIDPGHAQQGEQRIHVVLIGLGVIGVANVHPHRQAQQLAAEMVLQPSSQDLLSVEQIFRPDEPHDGIDEERIEGPRHAIGAGLQGLLIDAMVGVGRQRRALAGLEIADLVAAPTQRKGRRPPLRQQGQIDPEPPVRALRSRDRLEHQIDRRAAFHRLDRRRHVGQHTALGRDLVAPPGVIDEAQQADHRGQIVSGGVDANDRVAATIHQPIKDRGRHPGRIICRVVGLQPHGEASWQPHRGAKGGHHPPLCRNGDQILVAH